MKNKINLSVCICVYDAVQNIAIINFVYFGQVGGETCRNKCDSGVQTLSSIVFTFCAFYFFISLRNNYIIT